MVLYKRKSIILPDARPLPSNINRKIWYIKETGEWFLTYADFLQRLDFYRRHYFTCEITGTSCLTFFEALNSEEEQFQYVEKMFPLKLREPVAKFIHFNQIRRLDMLVEQVYARFKNDYFPGEVVTLRKVRSDYTHEDSNKQQALPSMQSHNSNVYIIKEKAEFNAVVDKATNTELAPAHAKYMLQETNGTASIIADEDQIYRDRSTFTKHLIKCFCKITLRRASSKMGAPWCVKDEYLPIYNLSPNWPEDMLKYKEDYVDPHYLMQQQQIAEMQKAAAAIDTRREAYMDRTETPDLKRLKTEENGLDSSPSIDQPFTQTDTFDHQAILQITEDLEIPFMAPRSSSITDALKAYSNELTLAANEMDKPNRSIGKLLHCYQFMIAFRGTLQLSEFSWDNLVDSLRFTDPKQLKDEFVTISFESNRKSVVEKLNPRNESIYQLIESLNSERLHIDVNSEEDINDELLDEPKSSGTSLIIECFCCLLRLFLDSKGNWTTLVTSKWLEDDGGDDNYDNKKVNDKEIKFAKGTDIEDTENGENSTSDIQLLFERVLAYRKVDWTDRLAKRQFNNGFWLIILIGILQDCMHLPMYTSSIHDFVRKIVPTEQSSSTAMNKQLWRNFCRNLSMEERINIMWILVEILGSYSSVVRSAMDDSMELCNQIRSERFKLNKDLKSSHTLVMELRDQLSLLEGKPDETDGGDHMKKLEDKLEEAGVHLKQLQQRKSFLDNKLIESDLQRLKPLGYDRYGNKVYWLEACGIPRPSHFTSLPHLLSNRIWIQGPAKEASLFYYDITEEQYDQWVALSTTVGKTEATKQVFHIFRDEVGRYFHHDDEGDIMLVDEQGIVNTVIQLSSLQKKVIDETPEKLLLTPDDWVFLQDPEQLSVLIDWWDNWGKREHETIKQVQAEMDAIIKTFNYHKELVEDVLLEKKEALRKEVTAVEITEEEFNVSNIAHDSAGPDIDDELEKIAEDIMALDDSSKTRKILTKLAQLESQRDELLAAKKTLDGKEKQNENGSKTTKLQKRALLLSRDKKVSILSDKLDKLLNLHKETAISSIAQWENKKAIETWGTELFKCSGNQKSARDPAPLSVGEIFSHVLEEASQAETLSLQQPDPEQTE